MSNDVWLEALSTEDCVALLHSEVVGRIAFGSAEGIAILPVNYRVVDGAEGPLIALRTRPGNAVDLAPPEVAFEIDGIDRVHRRGWSVLVRGVLRHVDISSTEAIARFDSLPWVPTERNSWLVIEPREITGRRLQTASVEWAFLASGYL